jgi:Protein of unknown function (DUF3489)
MTRAKSKTPKNSATSAVAPAPARAEPNPPGGKLGLIIQRLGAKTGATADELAGATGWQRHTVHGALSRLRSRGFAMRLETEGERRAYHLARAEG